MSRMSETIYVAVLYKSVESKYYHIERCLSEGGTYAPSPKRFPVTVRGISWDWKYCYVEGTQLEGVISSLQEMVLNTAIFLEGEYDSQVINYVMGRLRGNDI